MTTKRPLTLEEHKDIGRRLHAMSAALSQILVQVNRATPLGSTEVKATQRTLKELERLRSALEAAMFREHGDDASVRTYYPGHAVDPMPEETPEAAYRRGYCDGWVQAVDAMHELMFSDGMSRGAAYDQALDFGMHGSLHEWKTQGQRPGASRWDFPPGMVAHVHKASKGGCDE